MCPLLGSTMKVLLLAVILPAVIFAAPQKRLFLDEFVGSVFDMQTLKCDVQLLLDLIGNDATEQFCETECVKLIQEGHVLNFGCPLVCHSAQSLAQYFHVTPDPTADPNTVCQAGRK